MSDEYKKLNLKTKRLLGDKTWFELNPQYDMGGVDFENTPGAVIGPEDVPEGAGKEELLKAIKERKAKRQRAREKFNPKRAQMFRRDI